MGEVELFAQPDLGGRLVNRFVHFSDRESIDAIVESRQLQLSRTVVSAIFAAAVGASNVPGVQHARDGRRSCAVLFTTPVVPIMWFPEEVVWWRSEPLPITPLAVLEASGAVDLLDGSLGIDDDGWWHIDACVCEQCSCRRTVLAA